MKTSLIFFFLTTSALAQTAGSQALQDLGKITGVDLKVMDTILEGVHKDCDPKLQGPQILPSTATAPGQTEERIVASGLIGPALEDEVKIKGGKYGGKGGVGVRFTVDEATSLSIGGGPKSVGARGVFKFR
jgi:hypothetical protein